MTDEFLVLGAAKVQVDVGLAGAGRASQCRGCAAEQAAALCCDGHTGREMELVVVVESWTCADLASVEGAGESRFLYFLRCSRELQAEKEQLTASTSERDAWAQRSCAFHVHRKKCLIAASP